jgi:hypothetical protein
MWKYDWFKSIYFVALRGISPPRVNLVIYSENMPVYWDDLLHIAIISISFAKAA